MSRRNADDAAAVPRWKNQYELRANSNLVLQGDVPRSKASNEPTGEPESLKDKQMHIFGDLVERRKAPVVDHLKKREEEKRKKRNAPPPEDMVRPAKRSKTTTVLEQHELEGIKYQPRSKETRQAYESLLNFVRQKLGDQQRSIIMSAADEILATIKDEEIKPKEKQSLLEELLKTMSPDEYAQIHKICKEITDYIDEHQNEGPGEEEGISVLHVPGEEDEEEEEKEKETFAINEGDSEEEDGEETETLPTVHAQDQGDDEDTTLNLDPSTIDAYWLQRELSKFIEDAVQSQKMAGEVLDALQKIVRITELENELLELVGSIQFEFVKTLVHNRYKILYCTKLGQAQTKEEREKLEAEMLANPELSTILTQLKGKASSEGATLGGRMRAEQRALSKQESKRSRRETELKKEAMDILDETKDVGIPESEYIDLESISFQQGGHLMSNKQQCSLPEGTFQNSKKGYIEVVVPAYKPAVSKKPLVLIKDMPSWAQPAFEGMRDLNIIQSHCYPAFFESGDNILLCAPTGGGKTNCAMLAMMHEIGLHMDREANKLIDPEGFKIIYIAPMKSLVQEMVFNFGKRLSPYNIKVAELTGDTSMTKQQIAETQVIITTPEKWDIITRKAGDRTYTELVRLIIIDEIHLLHDERGPVLEAVIARTIRQIESSQEMVRLIGLSATLPNYQDVATLLRVKPQNLFCFPNSYRPVPLEQTFIGISVKKPIKRFQLMNKICYEKVMEQAGKNQVLVFVHSRKETAKTAREIRDKAIADDVIGKFLEDNASREILLTEAENAKSADLKDLLPYGFAIHHAGLTKDDRTLVEDLMADKHIQVLVSTATLAWGVNLPAHTVIIKGTKVYNPEKGDWVELSPLDVMQMLGRAGRPQFDIKGDGVLITERQEMQYYLSLQNEQLPIESQLLSKLVDNLNAEIVLGTIQNIKEAVNWLGYTYLYVCMLRSPELYGIAPSEKERDKLLVQRRYDLIHSAATVLAKNNLIKYDRKSGSFQSSDLGRIASYYYVTYHSMNIYNEHLKVTSGDIEILRVFSLSGEFKDIAVRPDEKMEVKKLLERVPIPVKENIDEPSAKINSLLQAYISRLSLEGFSLASDMVYVKQSAGRILRALFEIALKRGWANVAEKCLRFCIMIEKRMWGTQSPLRQFGKELSEEIALKLEKKDLTIDRLYDLDSQEIGEATDNPTQGKKVYDLVHQFPRLDLSATVQPITPSLLRVELTATPDFKFVEKYHGTSVAFWVLVEDVDGDTILHHEMFVLKQKFSQDEHYLTFTVPLTEPLPPQYFIKVVADRWLGAETILPVSFRHLILPERYPPQTDLLDLQPLPVAALKNPKFEAIYRDKFTYFNPVQTQVFNTVYNTDQNVLICAPTGSGKTICAEFAVLREFAREDPGRIVYIAPNPALAVERFKDWSQMFGTEPGLGKSVTTITGDWNVDQKLITQASIVISTPDQWDMASRRWRQRKIVQTVRLYIIDELHLIGGDNGPTIEIVVSRIRYINQQLKTKEAESGSKSKGNITRIVGLASSIANAKDIGEWIGANPHSLFNFHPNVRPVPLEILIQGFESPHFKQRIMAMEKPLLYAVSHHSEDKPVLIFTPSRKIAGQVARSIVTHSNADERPKRYLHVPQQDMEPVLQHITSRGLKEALLAGIGFCHEAMSEREQDLVKQLFASGAIQVLVATHNRCWHLHMQAYLVIIMGTQFYEGKEHRYVDYPITDMLQMIGRSGRLGIDESAKCVLLGDSRKKEFYKKFIYEPLPVESHLDHMLHDHLNAEIATKTIETKQEAVDYLTWTFCFRRITQNPNYYNMTGVSNRHVSDHLSDLVENTINDLVQSRCVAVEDELNLVSLNLGMIASYYYIKYTTIELFNFSLNEKTKMKGLIEILANASEFEELTIRKKEDNALRKLAAHLPVKINKPDYTSPSTKVNILLQSHFSRRVLTPDLMADLKIVLTTAPRLIQAMVDVIASNGWFSPALAAMELSQMITQAVWDNDSYLKQLPHITQEHIDRIMDARKSGTLSSADEDAEDVGVLELSDMDDELRNSLLRLDQKQMAELAQAVNRYPNIDLKFSLPNSVEHAGKIMKLVVELEREIDEGEKLPPAIAPYFPGEKTEGWWLVLGDPQRNHILGIKRVNVTKASVTTELEFEAPAAGRYKCALNFMCDSYRGCDHEWDVSFEVQQGQEAMDTSNS